MPSRKLKDSERRRCANACYTCKRRKERCDGRQPCSRCITRGVDAECSFTPSPTTKRRARNVQPNYVNPTSSRDEPQDLISPSISSSIEVFDQTLSQLSSQSGHDLHKAHTDRPQLSTLVQDGHGKFVFIGDAANLSFLQIIRRLVRDSVGPCAFTEDALQHLMVEAKPSDSAAWFVNIMDDTPVMPEEEEARYLVSWFFRSTSCVLNLFEEGEISQSIVCWYQKCSDEPEDKASAALFFLIFAIGAQTCPENKDREAEQYFNYGRFLTASIIMDDISISAVQSNILITMYLLGASRRNAAFMYLGSAVRAAYALGIQRHDINKHFKHSEYLLRERLWKVLRVLDLFMSASLGRPPSTHETRNTGIDENYSASNDLCAIFEGILTNIYSPQKVSNTHLERISEHHRKWANKFPLGLATDSIKPSKFIDEADGKETPNIGLCHLKEAYYWTIMLLARPSLTKSASKHMNKSAQDMSQWEPPTTATEPEQVLAFSCVDSAVRTVDLLKVMGDNREIPKRLPFVVNSLFVAALVLGTAYFNDLDHIFPLEKNMLGVRSLMARFSTHDPVAKGALQTIDKLQTACNIYVDERARRKMERQSLLVRNLFGTVHDGSRPQTPNPHEKANTTSLSVFSQSEEVLNTWSFEESIEDMDGGLMGMLPHEALEAFSLPTPTTIEFDSFDASFPLFSTVDVCSLEVEGNMGTNNLAFGL
ncbi:Putative transcriptional regulatory protein C3C7.04 [Fusarium oxysporum f. sp. cubense race 1]|uniref:Putative transcriptional regulatory protein C3C7.04 n=1 Tax=Fusarium oxysporum f. sp. cubense (strain race 1) TaxID=1229664 RepID=N4UDH0_FUSC1|nr:Putative transcriptional regulatory protein C3C7.04 [Fusarium oxysporum f. sp. cubense race 1]